MGFIEWLMNQIGYAVCHRMPERSLSYGGRALPVCARDTGLYIAFAATLIVMLAVYGRRGRSYPSRGKVAFLVILALPAVLDAVTSYSGLRESSNAMRLVTGALAGTGIAALLFPLTAGGLGGPCSGDRVLDSWLRLVALLTVPAALSLTAYVEWPSGYWFWAPLASASVVFAAMVLSFTLLSLIVERTKWAGSLGPLILAVLSVVMAAVLLIASNRLHWLVNRLL